jgi:hypothetical protein
MEKIYQAIRSDSNKKCVVTLVGSFPSFERTKPFMVHERHPIIEQMLKQGLDVTLVLCDPLYKTNNSPICEESVCDYVDRVNTLSRFVVFYVYMNGSQEIEKTIDVILFPNTVDDEDIIKFDAKIRRNNWLHYIQYFTGFDAGTNIFPVDYEGRRFVANGDCMIDWQTGVSSNNYTVETGKMTQYAFGLPPIVADNRFMIMPLNMDHLITNLQNYPEKGFPEHDYSVGCIKLMLFYMFSDELVFKSFLAYLKNRHEISAHFSVGKPAERKQYMEFDKKSELVGSSIFTILYRCNMIIGLDEINRRKGADIFPPNDVNAHLVSIVELATRPNPVFHQKMVIDILLEWCKTEMKQTLNQFWFSKMNNFICFLIGLMNIKVDFEFDAKVMQIDEILRCIRQVYDHICRAY